MVDEVDQLVLECISSQLIECRIDQRNLQVIVLSVSAGLNTGRDVQDVKTLLKDMKKWEKEQLTKT